MEAVDHEPLMAAVGRIAVRSAELGEVIDSIVGRLRPDEPSEDQRKRMLRQKLDAAIKASGEGRLDGNPALARALIRYCESWRELLLPGRNTAIHSTYIIDDDEDIDDDSDREIKITGIIKWDSRDEPELVTVEALNATAKSFAAATDYASVLSADIRDYLASGIITHRYD